MSMFAIAQRLLIAAQCNREHPMEYTLSRQMVNDMGRKEFWIDVAEILHLLYQEASSDQTLNKNVHFYTIGRYTS